MQQPFKHKVTQQTTFYPAMVTEVCASSSSGILQSVWVLFHRSICVSNLKWEGGEKPALLGSLTRANVSHWIQWLGLSLPNILSQEPDNELTTGTRLRAGQCSSLAAARDTSVFQNIQTGCGAHAASSLMGAASSFAEVNWLECKTYNSRPSSTDVENEWNCPTSPPIWLHGMHRGRTAFTLTEQLRLIICSVLAFKLVDCCNGTGESYVLPI